MSLYDQKRGDSWKLSSDSKNEVIKEVVGHLISNLESQNLSPLKGNAIEKKVKELVAKAEEFGKCKRQEIGNFAWIAKKRQLHEVDFNAEISSRSRSQSPMPTPTKKPHFDDSAMVRIF